MRRARVCVDQYAVVFFRFIIPSPAQKLEKFNKIDFDLWKKISILQRQHCPHCCHRRNIDIDRQCFSHVLTFVVNGTRHDFGLSGKASFFKRRRQFTMDIGMLWHYRQQQH